MTMTTAYYGPSFYEGLAEGSVRSARVVLARFFELYKPDSVIDVGCGVGTWLQAASELGVGRILGVDGSHVSPGMLRIPAERFVVHDLDNVRLERAERFDLAMSLEVAEHLKPERADTFVADLARLADVVLFSAAVPGQKGRHHVNEQFPSYWIRLFAQCGFACYDALRPSIWSDRSIEVWYRQNVLVFAKSAIFPGKRGVPEDYDMIHPELWAARSKVATAIEDSISLARHFASRVAPNRLVSMVRNARARQE